MNEMNEVFETLSTVSEKEKLNQGQIIVYVRMLRHWHKLGYPKKFTMTGKEFAASENRGDVSNAQSHIRALESKGLIRRKNIAYNNVGNTEYVIVRTALPITKKEKKGHEEVIKYLNEKLNRKFSLKTPAYKKLIYARMKEGYSVEDIKSVIDKKGKEWSGTEYEKYLNPNTLFSSSHFDVYLNQSESAPKAQNKGGKYI